MSLTSISRAIILEPFNNQSNTVEFVIWGFSSSPQLQLLLFIAFLLIYLLTIFGNFTIITLIFADSRLQKPMYCFLFNMSFLDFSYSTVTAPYLLYRFVTGNKKLSFMKCMVQLYFFNSFASTEYLLLTTMAYDRYVAICDPLFYPQTMNRRTCFCLAGSAWSAGFLAAVPVTALTSKLSFCMSTVINHYFCDVASLLKLACDDTLPVEITMFSQGVVLLFSCFLLTVMSYVYIISAILKIRSTEGRLKAFSTCGSHLTVVILFYLLVVCVYMKPSSTYSLDEEKFLSVFYVNIIPMLNPFIYSLRNKDVKDAFKNMYEKTLQNKNRKI
ncbi:unnamed protein product [Staurois parvus]|uniref:Olfactory receptor n=1 Tax=Staurois parvus TaxID=386267 RepID=A0ABN9GA37_9NEOB|nr:unnamed protein product [Staurois parvus]